MQQDALSTAVDSALAQCRLLSHPFYVRWTQGEVTMDELQRYAAQYRHFEAAVPSVLQSVADSARTDGIRTQARAILADETGGPATHLELFDRFSRALDAPSSAPSPAMQRLLDTYRECADSGDVAGLSAVLAYETQSAAIAATKADGLRAHGLVSDDVALAFWDVHARVDNEHTEWALQALADAVEEPAPVTAPARAAAQAWWAFLDEREAQRFGTA